MSLKNLGNFFFAMSAVLPVLLLSNEANANFALQGSGYYGGTQACPYNVRTGSGAVSLSDQEVENTKQIAKLNQTKTTKENKLEKLDEKLEKLREKLNKSLESEVVEFLTGVHIENAKQCSEYEAHANNKSCEQPPAAPAPQATSGPADVTRAASGQPATPAAVRRGDDTLDCNALYKTKDLPKSLRNLWITTNDRGQEGGYCMGDTFSSAGSVNTSICENINLRPKGGTTNKYRQSASTSECKQALIDYRKTHIEKGNIADDILRLEAQIETKEEKLEEARERRVEKAKLEANCENCNPHQSYQAPKRNLWEIGGNVLGALVFGGIGRQYDRSRMEYQAQLGYVPDQGYPTAVSMAYPFAQAAIYGAVAGGSGQGGFGCAGGAGGVGSQNGAYGNPYNPFASAYGPFEGNGGGAFGYPRDMYGNVLGGGAYAPGVGANGSFNGPNSLNGGAGGAICFTWPCPNQGGAGGNLNGSLALGPQFGNQYGNPYGNPYGGNLNGQLGLGNQFGNPFMNGGVNGGLATGNPFLNGNLGIQNPQYQMQMMQQQQQMLQQQQQQQQMLMQYYQAQAQQQQQALQRQMAVQQQASQVQQEIASLQMRLQMLYSSAYTGGTAGGGSLYGGTTLGGGSYFPGGFNASFNLNGGTTLGTVPGAPIGTGTIINGTRGR